MSQANVSVTPPTSLDPAHEAEALKVAPGTPAERLGGYPDLADRTRAVAPERSDSVDDDPLVAFLDDDDKIAAIREQAREEAERRAAEWGLDAMEDPASGDGTPS